MLSEWLLFNSKWAILQLYYRKNKLILNEIIMRFALYETNTRFFYWNNNLMVDMSSKSDTLSWLRTNQPLLLLLNCMFAFNQQGSNHDTNYYTINVVIFHLYHEGHFYCWRTPLAATSNWHINWYRVHCATGCIVTYNHSGDRYRIHRLM